MRQGWGREREGRERGGRVMQRYGKKGKHGTEGSLICTSFQKQIRGHELENTKAAKRRPEAEEEEEEDA